MKMNRLAGLMTCALLLGCARPEDNSFAVQAARRGDDCEAIAAGTAMDAYGHSVGPATDIYKIAYTRCMDRRRSQAEDDAKGAAAPTPRPD